MALTPQQIEAVVAANAVALGLPAFAFYARRTPSLDVANKANEATDGKEANETKADS